MTFRFLPALWITASLSLVVSCNDESRDSPAVKEALLQSEVDELQEKLRSLSGTIAEDLKQMKDEQSLLVSDASVKIVDLRAGNLSATIERYTLSEVAFSGLLSEPDLPSLYDSIKALESDAKATARPVLSVVISPLALSPESGAEFVLSDESDLDVPTGFSPPAADQENPELAPTDWSREVLGTKFTGKIIAREADRLLIGIDYNESTRLRNRAYPLPKIFEDKEPGQIEMPVVHQAGISTTVVSEIGQSEFLGTVVVPAEKTGGEKTLEAVFLLIRKM